LWSCPSNHMNTEKTSCFLRSVWREAAFLGVLAPPLAQGGLEGLAKTIDSYIVPLTMLGWAVAGITWIVAALMKHSSVSRGLKEQAHRSMDDVILLAVLLTVGVGFLTFVHGVISGAFGSAGPVPTWG